MKVYWVRHGQTDWNIEGRLQGQTDTVLAPAGRADAQVMAMELGGKKIERLFSSPLQRTMQTAEILNQELNCEIVRDARLIERDFMTFSGMALEDFRNRVKTDHDIESREAVLARTMDFIHSQLFVNEETTCVVTHGALLSILFQALGIFQAEKKIYHRCIYGIELNERHEIIATQQINLNGG